MYTLSCQFQLLFKLVSELQLDSPGGKVYDRLDMKMAGAPLIFLAWESVAYLAIAILYEYFMALPMAQVVRQSALVTDDSLRDDDVLAEEERVRSGAANDSTILVKDLKKQVSVCLSGDPCTIVIKNKNTLRLIYSLIIRQNGTLTFFPLVIPVRRWQVRSEGRVAGYSQRRMLRLAW